MSHPHKLLPPPSSKEEGKTTAADVGASSSVLYSLLQDLGLSATAQALCDELQRQGASVTPPHAHNSVASAIVGGQEPPAVVAETAPSERPRHLAAGSRRQGAAAVKPAEPAVVATTTPAAAAAAATAPVRTAPRPHTPSSDSSARTADNAAADVTDHGVQQASLLAKGDSQCAAAIAALAAAAVEPLQRSECATSFVEIETALLTLWAAETQTARTSHGVSSPASSSTAPPASAFRVATLLARAAWCELQITEIAFLQEYALTQSTTATRTSKLSSSPLSLAATTLFTAQQTLVDCAVQLMTAQQELRTVTGSSCASAAWQASPPSALASCSTLSSLMMSRLHQKAQVWLRNAECVMTWLLRRQTNFEAPPHPTRSGEQQQQQQRKRRCLEQTSTGNGEAASVHGAVPQHLASLQHTILGISAFSLSEGDDSASTPAHRFQHYLDIGNSAPASKTATTTKAPLLHDVNLPSSVRVAMTVQRMKLLLALMGNASAFCGAHSTVCAVVTATTCASTADEDDDTVAAAEIAVVRSWWTWRCVMQARLLQRTSQLLSHFDRSPSTGKTTGSVREHSKTALAARAAEKSLHETRSLVDLLDRHAKHLLLSPNASETILAPSLPTADSAEEPQQRRVRCQMMLAVRLLSVLEEEQTQRAAVFDRFVLDAATAPSSVALPSSFFLGTSPSPKAGSGPSELSSGTPTASSPSPASVGSPVWTLPLPTLPPQAPTPSAVRPTSTTAALDSTAPRTFNAATVALPDGENDALSRQSALHVLRWTPHFHHLLSTIATGRWQAAWKEQAVVHPGSNYNRARLNLMAAVAHAQELVRLQQRRPIAANGCEYVPHPNRNPSSDTAVLSTIEQLPRALQLFTLQSTSVLQRAHTRLATQKAKEKKLALSRRRNAEDRKPPLVRGRQRSVRSSVSPPAALSAPTATHDDASLMHRIADDLHQTLVRSSSSAPIGPADAPPAAVEEEEGENEESNVAPRAAAAAAAAAATASPDPLPATRSSRQTPEQQTQPPQRGRAPSSRSPSSSLSPSEDYSHVVAGRETSLPSSSNAVARTEESAERRYDDDDPQASSPTSPSSAASQLSVPEEEEEEEEVTEPSRESRSPSAGGDDGEVSEDAADDDVNEEEDDEDVFEEEAVISIYNPDEEDEEDEEAGGGYVVEGSNSDWGESVLEEEAEEEEEELEEEDEDENGSDASSADIYYERAEDEMKEEVECVEVTPDGRLLALLTARGRLTVLRLQAPDSTQRYEEEVLLDTMLPRVPAKRLQWYESLSSFVHFSPCHRFLLASVQFLSISEKQNTRGVLARAQSDNAGEVCIFSLHCASETNDVESAGEEATTEFDKKAGSEGLSRSSKAAFAERVQSLLLPAQSSEALYEAFHPHTAPCLSARWIDPRWWGGGRRSGWANASAEPLNTTQAAAAVAVRDTVRRVGLPGATPAPTQRKQKTKKVDSGALPPSWHVAAAVLLSEYQCLSVGVDDRILRWLPASGVVLQCVLTEPVQDVMVSPLMAAFYAMTDTGHLHMYDAWDERDVGEGGESLWKSHLDSCECAPHPLRLAVTDDGHPRYYRTGAATLPYAESTGRGQGGADSDEEDGADGGDGPNINTTGGGVVGGGFDDAVHSSRHIAHFTGPVTPVFQRMVDPAEKRRRRARVASEASSKIADITAGVFSKGGAFEEVAQAINERDEHAFQKALRRVVAVATAAVAPSTASFIPANSAQGDNGGRESRVDSFSHPRHGLPMNLRWLLPRGWSAHTPWDAQLGRRLIQHLLHRGGVSTSAAEGQVHYECEDLLGGVDSGIPEPANDYEHAKHDGVLAVDEDAAQNSERESAGSDGEDGEVEWEYDYTSFARGDHHNHHHNNNNAEDDDGTARPPGAVYMASGGGENEVAAVAAAATARDSPVAVRELSTNPTPARGPLRRIYYPAGACLVYESVARALCAAGDLSDRQRNEEMGPGGSTHHLLSFAFSGEPQWSAERQVRGGDDDDGADAAAARHHVSASNAPDSLPSVAWPATALARVVAWKRRLCTVDQYSRVPASVWARWESEILATSYHADVQPAASIPKKNTSHSSGCNAREGNQEDEQKSHVAWSATQLLAERGYAHCRDVWRRGAPATQRGLAATARNGRYLCIMATVGPYRKLVNPREPLKDMKGFYACVVFDVYAGAVLRVMPVCPVESTGLRGLNMRTSEQHEMDPKVPLYRLQCSVTIIPITSSAATGDNTSEKPLHRRAGFQSHQRSADNEDDEEVETKPRGVPCVAEDDSDVDAEPREIVAVTVGGLANTVYVFDAMNGRRLACSREVERQCSVSAAAAYETVRVTTSQTREAAASKAKTTADFTHESNMNAANAATAAAATALSSPSFPFPPSPPVLPASIRKPSDVISSIATWGRGTGFDGITDYSSPASSVTSTSTATTTEALQMHVGVDSPVTVLRDSNAANEENVNAAAVVDANAVLAGVLSAEKDLPRALQAAAASSTTSAAEWDLRSVLSRFHKQLSSAAPPAASFAGNACGDELTSESDWEADGDGWEHREAAPPSTDQKAAARKTHKNNGDGVGAGTTGGATPSTSLLQSFCQSLLGVGQQHFSSSSFSAIADDADTTHSGRVQRSVNGVLVPSHAAAWQQQRRRLLERLLRHYNVELIWQAYVTLFATSVTSPHAVAPQSALSALVQWARHVAHPRSALADKVPVGVALTATTSPSTWRWCAARRRSSTTTTTTIATPSQLTEGHSGIERDMADQTIPFAHVLQRREELALALQTLESKGGAAEAAASSQEQQQSGTRRSPQGTSSSDSLRARLCAQAALDGTMPQTRHGAVPGGRSSLPLPPAHHQNQMHVDVVNAVATWMDANGGFYVCFGSEDGGVYLMGGDVTS